MQQLCKILSYLGGYYNSNKFEIDLVKISDILEMPDDAVQKELGKLQNTGKIKLKDNLCILLKILPKKNKQFNKIYAPVDTMLWTEDMIITLDK